MSSSHNGSSSRGSSTRGKPSLPSHSFSSSSIPQKKPSLPVRFLKWTALQMVSFVLATILLTVGYAAITWTNIPSGSGASGQPVNQTLMQGIINNMNDLNTRLTKVNPSGTTLSGSSLCLDGVCKGDWNAINTGWRAVDGVSCNTVPATPSGSTVCLSSMRTGGQTINMCMGGVLIDLNLGCGGINN